MEEAKADYLGKNFWFQYFDLFDFVVADSPSRKFWDMMLMDCGAEWLSVI